MTQEYLNPNHIEPADPQIEEVVEASHFVVSDEGNLWDDIFEPEMTERIQATAKIVGPILGVALLALVIFFGVSQFNREQSQLAALSATEGEMTWSEARVRLTEIAKANATTAAIAALSTPTLAADVAQHATREATAVAVEAPDEVVQLFTNATCGGCHVIPGVPGAVGITGPSLVNLGEVAAQRIEGYTAEEYIHESIVNPDAYVVAECPNAPCVAGVMQPSFAETWSEAELALVVDYLASLGTE